MNVEEWLSIISGIAAAISLIIKVYKTNASSKVENTSPDSSAELPGTRN